VDGIFQSQYQKYAWVEAIIDILLRNFILISGGERTMENPSSLSYFLITTHQKFSQDTITFSLKEYIYLTRREPVYKNMYYSLTLENSLFSIYEVYFKNYWRQRWFKRLDCPLSRVCTMVKDVNSSCTCPGLKTWHHHCIWVTLEKFQYNLSQSFFMC
jgi:hypothetical protein